MSQKCDAKGFVSSLTAKGDAVVTLQKSEACGACAMKGACEILKTGRKSFSVVLENRVGAEVGDVVAISISESAVVKASAVLYLLPAILLVAGAVAGHQIMGPYNPNRDLAALTGSVAGLLFGFIAIFFWGKRLNDKVRPELEMVVEKGGSGIKDNLWMN